MSFYVECRWSSLTLLRGWDRLINPRIFGGLKDIEEPSKYWMLAVPNLRDGSPKRRYKGGSRDTSEGPEHWREYVMWISLPTMEL